MRLNKHTYTGLALISYITVCLTTFDLLYDSAQILSIALLAFIGWLYGSRIGLLAIIPTILLNSVIFLVVSDDLSDILLTYNPIGIIPTIAITFATGYIHDSTKKLKQSQTELEARVTDATRNLEKKTRQLIQQDEMERIRIGQDLHDGVGQCLTGMLLHCEVLSDKLCSEGLTQAELARRMTTRVRSSLQTIRKLSRSQLPIQPETISLETAFEEMASYFREISNTTIEVMCSETSVGLAPETVQHLYRIAQEAVHCAIYECRAHVLNIEFHTEGKNWLLRVFADRVHSVDHPASCLKSHTIKYRAKSIHSTLSGQPLPEGGFQITCTPLEVL